MHDNDFLVWGGDVRDRDAWSGTSHSTLLPPVYLTSNLFAASQKLQATTYPFVAFIALQARRGTAAAAAATSPVLTVLSRHQGPSIPSSTAPTSASTLTTHLTSHLLPRVQPYLARIKTHAAETATQQAWEVERRDRERALRAEQDRAFEESKRRDRARIEKRIAESQKAADDAQRAAEAEARAAQDARREAQARLAWEAKRMAWRRWGRRAFVPREPRPGNAEPHRGKTVRIGVRMPDGQRGVRFFGEGDSITAVYAYVDTLFLPSPSSSSDSDPTSPPDGAAEGEEGLVRTMQEAEKEGEAWWGFVLVLAYPRREIQWGQGVRIADVEGLKAGGQVVVELVEPASKNGKGKGKARASSPSDEKDDEYEGYDTEESE